MQSIEELMQTVPSLGGLDPEHTALIAGCARNEVFAKDAYLMREGEKADSFYAIRRGRVALETFVPQRGGLVVGTIDGGDLLGWSWLIPPYRTHLDARALTEVHAISFDATCLREKISGDPALGFSLMQRFVPVIVERLQATRVRMLDVYGDGRAV